MDWNHSMIVSGKEGREEGREEERKLLAKKALINNISINDIVKITGFTHEEIEALRDSAIPIDNKS